MSTRIVWLFLFCCQISFSHLPAQSLNWAIHNQSGSSSAFAAHHYPDRGVISGGIFNNTVGMDPLPGQGQVPGGVSVSGVHDAYLQKLTASGTLEWVVAWGGPGVDQVQDLAVDQSGSVYATGSFNDSVDFDPGPGLALRYATGGQAFFLIKFNANGVFQWVETAELNGATAECSGWGIAIDQLGNAVVTGDFQDSCLFAPGSPGASLVFNAGQSPNSFLAKFDPSGALLWIEATSEGGLSEVRSMALDPSDHILLTGRFENTVDFEPGTGVSLETALGSSDVFVQKLDPNGNLDWVFSLGGNGAEAGLEIQSDPSGQAYLAGNFYSSLDFDPGPGTQVVNALASGDVFLSKYDANGNFLWVDVWSSQDEEYVGGLEVDSLGQAWLGGTLRGILDLDPGPGTILSTAPGQGNLFFVQVDSLGVLQHAYEVIGSSLFQPIQLHDMDLNSSDALTLVGDFNGTIDIDPGPNNYPLNGSFFNSDAYVVNWNTDSCLSLALGLDSLAGVTCSSPGYLSFSTQGGNPPFQYNWSQFPSLTDSFAVIPQGGPATLVVTDSLGCSRSRSILVPGPLTVASENVAVMMTTLPFRPGVPNKFYLKAINQGCLPANGQLVLVMDPLNTYAMAQPSPNQVNGDTLIWNFNNLAFDSCFSVVVDFTTSTQANIGDVLCQELFTDSLPNDPFPNDNYFQLCAPVVNSYDPNDKRVFPAGECDPGYVLTDQPLTYAIRFQNTGNADAIQVFIADTLPTALDLNRTRVLASSHPDLVVEILDSHVLGFRYDQIFLPDSASDPGGSQGYLFFSIYPDSGVQDSTPIENRVAIYFDFNPPILTNWVRNTLVDSIPQLDLTVQQSLNVLLANQTGATYQWYDCADFSPIPGAINQSFSVPASGNYAVSLERDGCSGFSECISVTLAGATGPALLGLKTYPNPSSGIFHLDLGRELEDIEIEILNAMGQLVYTQRYPHAQLLSLEPNLSKGVYFLKVTSCQGCGVLPLKIN